MVRIPEDKMTCWELCSVIEREVKELGSDDNTPVAEHGPVERDVLFALLSQIRDAKHTLTVAHGMDDIEYAAFQRRIAEGETVAAAGVVA